LNPFEIRKINPTFVTQSATHPERRLLIAPHRKAKSAELLQVLKQKLARPAAQNMKGYAALIEPSEFNWSEAKQSCYGRNSCTGIGQAKCAGCCRSQDY
jgi:hypothetical protein